MEESEAFRLLTLASARDGRTVDQPTARVWADDLAGVGFEDAVWAAREHYRTSEKWLMPVHVLSLVRKRVAERRARELVLERRREEAAPRLGRDEIRQILGRGR